MLNLVHVASKVVNQDHVVPSECTSLYRYVSAKFSTFLHKYYLIQRFDSSLSIDPFEHHCQNWHSWESSSMRKSRQFSLDFLVGLVLVPKIFRQKISKKNFVM